MQTDLRSRTLDQQTLLLPPRPRTPVARSIRLISAPPASDLFERHRQIVRGRAGEDFAWAALALGAAGVLAASFYL